MTQRDERACVNCGIPKYEHDFTDPELVALSLACGDFEPIRGSRWVYKVF